jgi:hypothetical protein
MSTSHIVIGFPNAGVCGVGIWKPLIKSSHDLELHHFLLGDPEWGHFAGTANFFGMHASAPGRHSRWQSSIPICWLDS